uniref:Uncharacterized protein n=2 Tax=Caenorhabditis japonica TaxID=281687 RepID=A0A8R1EPG4_CAEJA
MRVKVQLISVCLYQSSATHQVASGQEDRLYSYPLESKFGTLFHFRFSVYKSHAPAPNTIKTWNDRYREESPRELDLDTLRKQVEMDRYQTIREMATALVFIHPTILRGFQAIGYVCFEGV